MGVGVVEEVLLEGRVLPSIRAPVIQEARAVRLQMVGFQTSKAGVPFGVGVPLLLEGCGHGLSLFGREEGESSEWPK